MITFTRRNQESKHRSVTCISCYGKLIQNFSQLLFFLFFCLCPWPVPQSGHLIYVVLSFEELLPLARSSMILYVSTKTAKFYHKILRNSIFFQSSSILWRFKGARTPRRDAVWEWRGECALSRMRSSSGNRSSVVLHWPELLPSPFGGTHSDVHAVWTQLRLLLP